jgi:hypothetical protein
MSVLQKLTEGIVQRNIGREGQAILTKWEQTGLLEGLTNERTKQNMAVLLENQAKELLREASSMAAGDVEGFAAVAFPIVRRVFGGLIANELVSVQPMSLPSGLIFFLDFTKADAGRQGAAGESLYGGGVVASQLTGGVSLSGRDDQSGFYSLSTGYTAATGSITFNHGTEAAAGARAGAATVDVVDGGASALLDYDADLKGRHCVVLKATAGSSTAVAESSSGINSMQDKGQIDAGIPQALEVTGISGGGAFDGASGVIDSRNGDIWLLGLGQSIGDVGGGDDTNEILAQFRLVRRHTRYLGESADGLRAVSGVSQIVLELINLYENDGDLAPGDIDTQTKLETEITASGAAMASTAAERSVFVAVMAADAANLVVTCSVPIKDELTGGTGLGSIVGRDQWGLEEPSPGTGKRGADGGSGTQLGDVNKNVIPEIDIKVDSVAVTAQTKKLKAKWTPELAQDLNAYHNLDAEVELTGILSEQIALEIDQEILGDLVRGATASTLHWSRHPGKFLNRTTGGDLTNDGLSGPDFTGTVSEWYETLIETVNDVSAQIHRKTLRGGANFLVCSPEVANLLEFTSGFRAKATHDQEKGNIGAVNVGSISKKFDVYVDPYFLRNVILVGRKGGSFLESGYVYAPYVPLQTTPTIFGTEDFVPRKGVMTRYAKKMVRPDLYGIVVVQDLLG